MGTEDKAAKRRKESASRARTAYSQTDRMLNDFALRSFSDVADGDYIAARMACRAQLVEQFLWSSQQAIEKYFKCILLMHRIPATNVGHDLAACLSAIEGSGKITLDLIAETQQFVEHLDRFAMSRYLERSNVAFGGHLIALDRATWQLRRFCTLAPEPRLVKLRPGYPAPIVRLEGHYMERILDSPKDPAREPLLWQNAFFGKRKRRAVKLKHWFKAKNSPLYLNPQILDEVLKYVYMPRELVKTYRAHTKP